MSGRPPRASLLRLLLLAFLGTALIACSAKLAPPGPFADGGGPGPSLTQATFRTEDGLKLPLRAWLPEESPSAVILALHGMNDYSAAFDLPGAAFAGKGIATYAYDQRGFGEAPNRGLWPGAGTYRADLRHAARLIKQKHPQAPLFLLGDSFGGAVTATALAEAWPPEVEGAILVAPAVMDRESLGPLASASLWLARLIAPGWKPTGADLKIQATDNIPLLRAFSNDPLVIKGTRIDTVYGLVGLMDAAQDSGAELGGGPVLLLYGGKDEVIPRKAIDRFWEKLEAANPQAQRLDFDSGWHWLLRDLERQRVFDALLEWMERQGAMRQAHRSPLVAPQHLQ